MYSIFKRNDNGGIKEEKLIYGPRHFYTKRQGSIVKRKDGYHVISEHKDKEGHYKNLGGPYKTREEAEKRLKQVEFFKHQ